MVFLDCVEREWDGAALWTPFLKDSAGEQGELGLDKLTGLFRTLDGAIYLDNSTFGAILGSVLRVCTLELKSYHAVERAALGLYVLPSLRGLLKS